MCWAHTLILQEQEEKVDSDWLPNMFLFVKQFDTQTSAVIIAANHTSFQAH